MLKSPNRPRAPSAATLRVLYQLAYISSGTAVGIGALCAEERRRRTQIVQKVADNAKRLRQSPRYAHGAAAAAVREQDLENDFGWDGEGVEAGNQRHAVAARRRARMVENHEGGKTAQLPSVVEDEYGRLTEGNRKKSRRREHHGRPGFVEGYGNRDRVAKADLDARGKQKIQNSAKHIPVLPNAIPSQLSACEGSIYRDDTSLEWMSYQKPFHYGFRREGLLRPTSDKMKLFHTTKEGQSYQSSESEVLIEKTFETHHLWSARSSEDLIPPQTLERDVALFFKSVNQDAFPRLSMHFANRIADGLLGLSLEMNTSARLTRSLMLWKLAANSLSFDDLYNVARSFGNIAQDLGPEATMQFYAALFATSVWQSATQGEQIWAVLRLRGEALKLDSQSKGEEEWFDQIVEAVDLPDRADVVHLLRQECIRLIAEDHLSSAVKLRCATMRLRRKQRDVDPELDAKLFDAAIGGRHLSLCAQLLRARNNAWYGDNKEQKDAFIKLCFEEGAIGMLHGLFGNLHGNGGLKHNATLSPQSYTYLCRCFADMYDNKAAFKKYYDRLSHEMRVSLADAGVATKALTLKADWNAQRNLSKVYRSYKNALIYYEHVVDANVRPLHIAMIEIELSANHPEGAIKALSELNQDGVDGNIATLTALALAKQKNWLAFGQLFEALKHNGPTWFWTPTMKRAYNNALRLFSRSHSAQQVSDFVLMSINDLRLVPNQSTWEVMMSSLVSKRAIPLLEHWINFSVSAESKSNMNSGIAAAIIKSWYLGFRHSHVMVMWFCRNLSQAAPSLHSNALLDIVRETIGFDLRKLAGANAPWMAQIIRARQAMVENSHGEIPRPGYRYDKKLYDRGRLVNADGTLSERGTTVYADVRSDGLAHDVKAGENCKVAPPDTTIASRTASYDVETGEIRNAASTKTAHTAHVPVELDDLAPIGTVHTRYPPQFDALGPMEAHDLSPTETAHAHEQPNLANLDAEDARTSTPTETAFTNDPQDAAMPPGDETRTSVLTTHQNNATFEELRPAYDMNTLGDQDQDIAAETSSAEDPERQMILQFSLQEYDLVLELYQKSLDGIGLPASPLALEIAVEASLRNTNDRHEAENIISAARDAGMNVTCAMGPLIINQIRHSPLKDAQSVAELRNSVIDYYRMNELNGLHVKHHVATQAAHAMIQAGCAQHGINLLSTILQSSWSEEKPLDIAVMSVWFSGYAALGILRGMHWVIEEVLHQGLSIDQAFLRTLKRARRPVSRLDDGSIVYVKQKPKIVALLEHWHRQCSDRRMAQMQDSKVFGRKLVKLLITAANGERRLAPQPSRRGPRYRSRAKKSRSAAPTPSSPAKPGHH